MTTPLIKFKRIRFTLAGIFFASIAALAACTHNATNNEIRNAYLVYLNAGTSLTSVVSHTEGAGLIEETLENAEKTYTRYTKYDAGKKTVFITHTFQDYHPATTKSVSMSGSIVQAISDTLISVDGELDFPNGRPARLCFMNVKIDKIPDGKGTDKLYPRSGTLIADRRSLSCNELMHNIWR